MSTLIRARVEDEGTGQRTDPWHPEASDLHTPTSAGPSRRRWLRAAIGLCSSIFIGGLLVSCDAKLPQSEVVLYTSVDQPIAQKVIDAFQKRKGIKVRIVTDTEATKSVGLAERLRAEKANPVCHVWWGNEPFHTIALADEGMFKPLINTPAAQQVSLDEIGSTFKDGALRWAGSGLRVRVMAVSENAGPIAGSIQDLLDTTFKGKITLARPVAGTTAGHVAALYTLWGQEKADDFFRKLRDNGAVMVGGNSVVAEQVGKDNMLLGLTDNDDIVAAQRSGGEVWQIVPDQGAAGIGTLAIPTTVALVDRADLPESAAQLAAYLLSSEVEQQLLDAHFTQASVRSGPGTIKVMDVSYSAIAKLLRIAPQRAANILDGREP